jgi:hypothetical protein
MLWKPSKIVLHATGLPTLSQWVELGPAHDARLRNLEALYQGMGWKHGPHAFVSRSHINGFSTLYDRGTHDSCENAVAFGIEQAGNYNIGYDAYLTGDGALVRTNAILCVSTLALRFHVAEVDIIPHSACRADGHFNCPGNENDMGLFVRDVRAKMVDLLNHPATGSSFSLPPWPAPGDPFFALGARVWNKWLSLAYDVPAVAALTGRGEGECSLNVKLRGDSGTAGGLYQWHKPRRDLILAGCGIDVWAEPDIEKHVAAAHWELHNSERVALEKIEAATTIADAGAAVAVFYCRAGAPLAAQKTGAYAQRWATLFQNDPSLLQVSP